MSLTFLAKSSANSWKMSFEGQVLCQRMLIGPCAFATRGATTAAAVASAAPLRNFRRELLRRMRVLAFIGSSQKGNTCQLQMLLLTFGPRIVEGRDPSTSVESTGIGYRRRSARPKPSFHLFSALADRHASMTTDVTPAETNPNARGSLRHSRQP